MTLAVEFSNSKLGVLCLLLNMFYLSVSGVAHAGSLRYECFVDGVEVDVVERRRDGSTDRSYVFKTPRGGAAEIDYYPSNEYSLPRVIAMFEFSEACISSVEYVKKANLSEQDRACRVIDFLNDNYGFGGIEKERLVTYLVTERRDRYKPYLFCLR